ncbi:MAG: hypothetical protein AB1451_02780 [Nitrospirota bacterium]
MTTSAETVIAPALAIRTLGTCEILLRGDVVPNEAWDDPKDLELLLALVTLDGRQVPRAELVELVWPDLDDDRGVTEFYAALHRLQTALGRPERKGPGFVTMVGARVSLHPMFCWADCWAFEEAVRRAHRLEVFGQRFAARARLEEAKSLYKGEYLPAWDGVPWVEAKRHALDRQWRWVERQLSAA